MRYIKVFQAISLVLGLTLFVYLIYSIGVNEILGSIKVVGFGFIPLILLSATRHVVRSTAWLHCIEEDHRQIRLFDLFNVRLAGEAVRLLGFSGVVLGETSKAVLIRKRLPMVHGMSSIIIENLCYTLSAIFVIISGLTLLVANFTTRTSVKMMGLGLSIGMIVTILAVRYVISRRIKLFTRITQWLADKTGLEWFKSRVSGIEHTEENVHGFYKRRGGTFIGVLLLEVLANFINITEVYLILYFIGTNVTVVIAYIVEAVSKVVNILFFFVPGQIGVTEGSNVLLLKMMGMGVAAAVALSLIEKMRMIFWIGYGLIVWAVVFRKGTKKTSEESSVAAEEMSPKRV